MNYIATSKQTIFTASADCIVMLNLWNESGEQRHLFVASDSKIFNGSNDNDYDVMDKGSPNNNPDTVHVIDLKQGESIYAFTDKENVVQFEINIE